MDIYQKIWNADQQGNGIQAVLNSSDGNTERGYVVVNELKTAGTSHQLLPEVFIPPAKLQTYELCKKLFNNYTLDKTKREDTTPEENREVHELLEAIVNSPPMRVAREYMEAQTGESFPPDRWYTILEQVWFKQFDKSSSRDITGFEHVVVGEQKGGKVSGYHFWYKYWLDDTFNLLASDDISYQGTRGGNQEGNILVPEVSTIAFKWEAFDYEAEARRPLYKKIGGFFNGCSIEGLLAIGTIRFLPRGRAPKEAIINNAKYNIRLYRSDNNQHLITYYPEFIEQVEIGTGDGGSGGGTGGGGTGGEGTGDGGTGGGSGATDALIRIIAALVNPAGNDAGLESVTLINVSPQSVSLNGAHIVDKNDNTFSIPDTSLAPGQAQTITLPANTAQLSNKGGRIALRAADGTILHEVSYTREQAKQQGWTVVF